MSDYTAYLPVRPDPQPRNDTKVVRLTNEAHGTLRKLASHHNVTMSQMVVALIRGAFDTVKGK
tara:strand:+ start:89 stop:277 length:189 start_codon:yes stop_codon:yes gene_type:complete